MVASVFMGKLTIGKCGKCLECLMVHICCHMAGDFNQASDLGYSCTDVPYDCRIWATVTKPGNAAGRLGHHKTCMINGIKACSSTLLNNVP